MPESLFKDTVHLRVKLDFFAPLFRVCNIVEYERLIEKVFLSHLRVILLIGILQLPDQVVEPVAVLVDVGNRVEIVLLEILIHFVDISDRITTHLGLLLTLRGSLYLTLLLVCWLVRFNIAWIRSRHIFSETQVSFFLVLVVRLIGLLGGKLLLKWLVGTLLIVVVLLPERLVMILEIVLVEVPLVHSFLPFLVGDEKRCKFWIVFNVVA